MICVNFSIKEPIFKLDVKQLLPDGYKALFNNETDWLPWGAYPDATIFYRESRFIPHDFEYFWLGPDPTYPRGWDKLTLPRLAVYALMEDTAAGSDGAAEDATAPYFYFGSTHFDHGDDMEGSNIDCTQSAYEVLNFSTPLAARYPLVWVGDFNSKTANNNAYSILTNASAPVHMEDSYYESTTSYQICTNQDPAPAYDYDNSIDHIFHANNEDIASYEVLDWTVDMYVYGEEQQYASDHWAIISTINIKSIA